MTTESVSISPRVERRYPLTRLQSEVWTSQRLNPNSPLANMGAQHLIDGRLEPDRFVAAFDAVVRRCDALRTVVDDSAVTAVGVVLASPPKRTEVIDVDLADVDRWCADRIAQPIDATSCGYDSVLLRHDADTWTWWLDLHHVVTDATSQSLVHRLTSDAYEGHDVEVSSFADFAVGAVDAEADDAADDAVASIPDAAPLQPFGERGPTTTSSPCIPFEIDGVTSDQLTAAASAAFPAVSADLGLAALFASALACSMQRLDGRSSFSVGIPVGNRSDRRRRDLVGPLMELHGVDVTIEPGDTCRSLVDRTLASILGMLRATRRGGVPPRPDFEMVVNVFRVDYGTFAGHPEVASWVRAPHVDPAHTLRVHVFDHGNDLELQLDVNDALVAGSSTPELDRRVGGVVAAMLADPDGSIEALSVVTPADRAAAAALTPEPPSNPELTPVHERIAESLRSHPDWIVAEDDTGRVRADDFDRRVSHCSRWLASLGVGHGDRVGLRMPRGVDVLVAMHAVLRRGAAFVMLDPVDPEARHQVIADDAELTTIVDELPTVAADSANAGGELRDVVVDGEDLAYVLYTSGSTGVPKGVPITHRGLADYLDFAVTTYTTPDTPPVVALHSALVFDLTITSLFLSFVSGGTVVVFPGDPVVALGRIAADDRITFLKATPSQLEIFARMVDSPCPIDTVVVGGEAFRRPVAVATRAACAPDVRIFNEYGPTEAVVGCMIHMWDPESDTGADVPIGHASPGCEIALLDQFGQPAARGAWAELYVRRVGMASGYLNRPDLTAERFVDIGEVPGRLGATERGFWYRTGDRARIERDGVTVYGGRLDDQIKVNGVRLEPAEVEAALVDHPDVASALVRLWTPSDRVAGARCVRCGLGTEVPDVDIDGSGVCSVCRSYDAVVPQTEAWFRTEADLAARLADARARSRGDYDCLHLLSGGKDSSYALYQLVERGWRVHALTLDNGFISEGAKENIRQSIDALGITHEFATTDSMNDIFRDSLDRHSNVCQGCYKTIYTKAVARADEMGIPVIVTGLSRGQFFETRLIPAQFEQGRFDPEAIDATVLEARKVYHQVPDAVTQLLPEQRVFDDESIFDRIEFVDFYRYVDVDLAELYRYLEENAPWVRPADTGRSTNCLINVAGIQVHHAERGYHNYAEPYSWDVRLGHKTRAEALAELDDLVPDGVDNSEVRSLLDTVEYRPKKVEILTAWYQSVDGVDLDPDVLRRHLRDRVASHAVPAAFVRIDEVPLAASAKADASLLPSPTRMHRQGVAAVEARTDVERRLCAIWADVLRLEHVGVTDDFFDLGGDSLAALEVVAAIVENLGVSLDDASVFHARTVAELAALVEQAADPLGGVIGADVVIPDVAGAPLSAGEESMLFDHRSDPTDVRYNVTRWYRLPVDTDLIRFEGAIRDVAMIHGPLHTAYDPERTNLGRDGAVEFTRLDDMTVGDFEVFARGQRGVAFDLDRGPLVRIHCARTEADDGTACLSVLIGLHHISVDAGSFDVLWDQVSAAYDGKPLIEPTVSYAAHGAWQRDAVHPQHREHWLADRRASDELASPSSVSLPMPMPAEPDGYRFAWLDITTAQLRQAPGRTPFVTALAATAATLSRYGADGHVEIGVTASVRDHPSTAPLVGYFLNTLPIRIDVSEDASFADVAASADELVARAVEHRTYPFASIIRDARADGLRPPDVSAMLAYERLSAPSLDGHEASHEILPSGTAVSDITFFVHERGERLSVGLEYSGHVLSGSDAQRMLEAFSTTLTGAVDRPNTSLATLAPADDDGTDLLGPALPEYATTVLSTIVDRAAASPDGVAVVDANGATVTYAELLRRALATAETIDAERGLVGVCVARSVDVVVGILAAQLAGAGYVPIDPAAPADRLASILEAVSVSTVLTDVTNADRFASAEIITQADAADADVAAADDLFDRCRERIDRIDPGDTAYVIFTSGSTGTPRGVAVSHSNLAASTAARVVAYDTPPGRFMMTSSIGFDSSIVGLFWPLASGGTVVMPADDAVRDVDRLVSFVATAQVTHLLMVPSLYRALLTRGGDQLASLEVAIVAGEACTPDIASLHRSLLPSTELYDEYGPTEASVWATVHRITAVDAVAVPIGRPIAGVTVRVADSAGRTVPVGVAGELLISGPTVTAGYVNDSEATGERFVVREGVRWYHTGDLVRARANGILDYLGRVDDQLNVGGVRIEPGEIESALVAQISVSDAVVVASSDGRSRLVAHVEGPGGDADAVRRAVAERLPGTHVPHRIVWHDQLPRTSHGKIDRNAAADLPLSSVEPRASTEPKLGALAAEIVGIWRTVLDRADIETSTDYFEVGGDSLAAVEIVMAVEALVDEAVTIQTLLDGRTPSGMAAILAPDVTVAVDAVPTRVGRIATMQTGAADGPLVICTPGWDDAFGYRSLADALPEHVRVLAVSVSDADSQAIPTTIEDIGDVFEQLLEDEAAADLRRPIAVLGWSTGGVVAYEMARRLQDRGADLQLVAMVDTFFPGAEQHLWSNRWWKYKTLLSPAAFADEVSTTVRRRARKYSANLGKRLLAWSGNPVPEAPERTSSGGVPLEAFGYRPADHGISIALYAASTTNPDRTYRGWRQVAAVDVVPVEGRHRGFRSIMDPDRVHYIADDVARRLADSG